MKWSPAIQEGAVTVASAWAVYRRNHERATSSGTFKMSRKNVYLSIDYTVGPQCASTSRRIVANASFVQGKI
jgi:hypothetical protein